MYKVNLQLNVITKYFILLIVLTTFNACSHKKKVEVKNGNGIVLESYFVDKKNPDIKVGLYQKFYEDGKLAESINYNKDGKQHGEHISYYPSGGVMIKEDIVDNRNNGKYLSFYENGNPEQEGTYKDNKAYGLWKTYFEDKKNMVKYEAEFKDGRYNGVFKEYHPNGKLYAEGNKIEITDDLAVFDGKVQVYDTLGKLEKILTYDKGRQINKEEIKK